MLLKPKELIKENLILRQQDIKKFNSNSWEKYFIACPCCNNTSAIEIFIKDEFTFCSCIECSTVYVNPRPSLKRLLDFYSDASFLKHWSDKIFPSTEEVRKKIIAYPMLERILRWTLNPDLLVDIGAGCGIFCSVVKERLKTEVIAIDSSDFFIKDLNQKGIRLIKKSIEDISEDDVSDVDIVTAFEIIEHLFDPKVLLQKSHKMLKQNGLLVMSTVNIKGFDLSVLGPLSENIVAPIHLNYFHPESMKKFLELNGFSILELSTPGKMDTEIVREKIKIGINLSSFFIDLLNNSSISANFQKFISENNLSSHMVVVARKNG
jgi:2-polyprenyl-3-methyl-5-hydroxy-6-metoxy-1,4-benzoquinol methylase